MRHPASFDGNGWIPPTPPPVRKEAAGRYWVDNYEIVNTGPRRWTLSRIDRDHVRTCGGGRDDGSALIDNYRTLSEAVADAVDSWINERHPETIAKAAEMGVPTPTRFVIGPSTRR